MKKAFTMIELIFVIVIIGILAAVAIPKLAATRDDAKISVEIASVKQIIDNLGAEYTSQAAFGATSIADADSSTNCFDVAAVAATPGAITVAVIGAAVTGVCDTAVLTAVTAEASAMGITAAAGASKTYLLGGSTVVR